MAEAFAKYSPQAKGDRLRQGSVVVGLIQTRQRLETIGAADALVLDEEIHPYALVLTQDCDLERDFERRGGKSGAGSPLANVLLCEATTTVLLKGNLPQGKDIWKRVIQNKDERYQCLENVPAEYDVAAQGIAALGIDFKRYFTISTDEIYRRIELGQAVCRCRLVTPYVEHFVSRFYYFQSRIALPVDHQIAM